MDSANPWRGNAAQFTTAARDTMSTEQDRLLLRETIEAGCRQAAFVSDVGITLVDCGPG